MSVELSQAELLKEWFTPVAEDEQGTDVDERLSLKADIERISERLSELWFSADYTWIEWRDTDILTVLQQWLPPDSSEETQFRQCALPGRLAEFIAWLEPMIGQWEAQEAQATSERGLENPEYARDPILGTRYYRWVDGEYLYADDPDAPYRPGDIAWLSLDDRIAAQDLTREHYDADTDRWRRLADGGGYEYQDRDDRQWERSDGASWLRQHSEVFGWLPYDRATNTWFHQGQWRSRDEIAATGTHAHGGVIPIYQIRGWEHLEDEPWAEGWYAQPGTEGYAYLHSPEDVPAPDDPGWSTVPPAPPPELTEEEAEEIVALGFTLDDAAEAIDALTEVIAGLGLQK